MNSQIKILLNSIPGLGDVYKSATLGDYYRLKTNGIAGFQSLEKDLMKDVIVREILRVFGSNAAALAKAELDRSPVLETGTHLGFINDTDVGHKTGDLRSRLNQNILISAALAKDSGAKVHLGLYGSNVSMSHPMSGGAFQIGDFVFPANRPAAINSATLYATDKISDEYFNDSLLLAAKLKQLRKMTPDNGFLQEKLTFLLAPLDKLSTNYKGVQVNYDSMNAGKRAAVDKALEQYNLEYLDHEYQHLKNIFASPLAENMADQVTLAQADSINRLLDGTGITHYQVDCTKVSIEFFARALETPGSFWNEIFADPDSFKIFHTCLSGIRAGWAHDESPFMAVHRKNGIGSMRKMGVDEIELSPQNLVRHLRDGKIAPGTCLQVLAGLSAGIMEHGGFFQSSYAAEVNIYFRIYLAMVDKTDLCDMVRKINSDMILLSLGAIAGQDRQLLKPGDIMKMPNRVNFINNIPNIPGRVAVELGADNVVEYLDIMAPGFLNKDIEIEEYANARQVTAGKIAAVAGVFQR